MLAQNVDLNIIHFSHYHFGRIEPKTYTTELSALKCLSSFTLLEPEMPNIAADELVDALDLNINAKMVALSDCKLQTVHASCTEIS